MSAATIEFENVGRNELAEVLQNIVLSEHEYSDGEVSVLSDDAEHVADTLRSQYQQPYVEGDEEEWARMVLDDQIVVDEENFDNVNDDVNIKDLESEALEESKDDRDNGGQGSYNVYNYILAKSTH